MRLGIGLLLICFFSCSALAYGLSLEEVEGRMVKGGYLDSLYAAYWAAGQGEVITPILEDMLFNPRKYQKVPFADTSAYPFNVIWALAHIDSLRSLQILKKFSVWTTQKYSQELARLAIKGLRLRRTKQSKAYGVLVRATAKLLEQPDKKAQVLKLIKSGQGVKILRPYLVKKEEEGPRSGPAVFDFIELVPEGKRGYLQRVGGDFTSFI